MNHEQSSEYWEALGRRHPLRRLAGELLAVVLLMVIAAAYVCGFAYHAARLTVGTGAGGGDRIDSLRLECAMEGDPADVVARAEIRRLSRPLFPQGTRLLADY